MSAVEYSHYQLVGGLDQETAERAARRNILYYTVTKAFNKCVFLPVIVIYFIDQIGFSIQEIGILAALYAFVMLVMQMPSGYLADRFGKALCIRLSAIFLVASSLIYVFMASKTGIVLGQILEAMGFALLIGAAEALVHDSLEVTNRLRDYSKVLSRAQSVGLIGNAILVALVPLSYALDPRLPFLIGALAFCVMLFTSSRMRELIQPGTLHKDARQKVNFRAILRYKGLIVFAFLFGTMAAIYFAFDMTTLALREFGVRPEFLGWVFSGASIFGALIGLGIHHLKKLPLGWYMLLDMAILTLPFATALTANLWLFVPAVVLCVSFWRFRRIIYQDYLLRRYPTRLKATLISVMGTTENINNLWVPIAVTGSVSAFGIQQGLGWIAVAVIILAVPFILLGKSVLQKPDSP